MFEPFLGTCGVSIRVARGAFVLSARHSAGMKSAGNCTTMFMLNT